MFSHKLIAPLDRFKRNGSIAGRDIYDIHYFMYRISLPSKDYSRKDRICSADFFRTLITLSKKYNTNYYKPRFEHAVARRNIQVYQENSENRNIDFSQPRSCISE